MDKNNYEYKRNELLSKEKYLEKKINMELNELLKVGDDALKLIDSDDGMFEPKCKISAAPKTKGDVELIFTDNYNEYTLHDMLDKEDDTD